MLLLLGALALAGFFLRFYHLDADPPWWSYVYNTDEGHYSYTARNRLVTGQWFGNEARYGLTTPLFAGAQFLVAFIGNGDSSIAIYRLVSVVCGVLSCGLMALFFQDPWRRMAAVALASTSFMGFVHSRLGITEMMLTLMIQITVLLIWQAWARASFPWAMMAGAAAVGAVMVKPTAVFITPILLICPLIGRTPNRAARLYWLGTAAGMALVVLLWSVLVVLPFWHTWRQMLAQSTSFARGTISLDLTTARSLWRFLLSPALQSMPLLWPLALCWCVFAYLPRWWKGTCDVLDTLLMVWIAAAVILLGIPAYQPARWQMVLFPAVIGAGLKFLPNLQQPRMAIASLAAAVGVASVYALDLTGQLLSGSVEVNPANGVLCHYATALIATGLFSATWIVSRVLRVEKWQRLAAAVIAVELAVQCWFFAAYSWPSFFRPSPWDAVARDLEQMEPRGAAVFSGDLVQDFSLRAKIHVLPTFYLLDKPTDSAIRDFFARQNCVPTYFILVGGNVNNWTAYAPTFVDSLVETERYSLIIGGVGRQDVHLFRFRSYDWLMTMKK